VAVRSHFVGWVDTPLYAAALDVFLETFPLGCGITGYQAMGAGVPLVSYLDSNTVFGMQYWSEILQKAGSIQDVTRAQLDEYPVLCARSPAEYVDLVSRLIADEPYRREWKAREARFYHDEIHGIARYSKRYFDTVRSIASKALSP
jgi:predicted O-linked N-acetylglucosamine transferase (SPINDLY family)